ncbi:unnamed protein product, partial [Timema podura]|nr:unnamed protein product [Timema podura]
MYEGDFRWTDGLIFTYSKLFCCNIGNNVVCKRRIYGLVLSLATRCER